MRGGVVTTKRRLLGAAMSLWLAGCGGVGGAAVGSPSGARGPAKPPPPAARPLASEGKLARAAVREVVSQGLGVFLQHVELDEQPVRVDGKFHGFRIAALHDGGFWTGVDLKPGDVVTAVNGFPIEHPEQAQTALESLEVASELRVAYERDGKARELVYAIVDEP
jgi:type II secretion system protein C